MKQYSVIKDFGEGNLGHFYQVKDINTQYILKKLKSSTNNRLTETEVAEIFARKKQNLKQFKEDSFFPQPQSYFQEEGEYYLVQEYKCLKNRYLILEYLSGGGFGRTFIAYDLDIPKPAENPCIIKQLKPLNSAPEILRIARRLFKQEAEVLQKLGKHDQIPQLLAYFEEEEEFYLVQEYINGKTLSQELIEKTSFNETETITFLQDTLQILEFIHQEKKVHRDIKPSNLIRRASDGKIVLIDFGSVKQIATQGTENTIIGTPGYMPVEQATGQPVTEASDIYSLGITAIEALTGIYPTNIITNSKTGELDWLPPPTTQKINQPLATILSKMVRHKIGDRYSTATEVLKDLQNLTLETPKPAKTPLLLGVAGVAIVTLSTVSYVSLKPPQTSVTPTPTPSPTTQATPNPVTTTYNNNKISIEYPENWTLTADGITNDILITPNSTTDVHLNITQNNVENSSIETYSQDKVKNISETITSTPVTYTASKISQKEAYQTSYEQNNLKTLEIWTLSNNELTTIIYTAPKDKYDQYYPAVADMLETLQLN